MTDDPKAPDGLEPDEMEPDELDDDLTEDQELADDEAAEEAGIAGAGLAGAEPSVEPGRHAGRDAAHRRPGTGAAGGGGPSRTVRNRSMFIDPALRIRDRVSELLVIGILLVFAGIFLNALAFGHGGAFSPVPTPGPSIDLGSIPPAATPPPTPAPIPTEFQVPPKSPSPSASAGPAAS